MLTDTINDEMNAIKKMARQSHITPEDEQRLKRFFGEADPKTVEYRRRVQQTGFDFIMEPHVTQEEALAILESSETKSILAELDGYQPAYS